LWVGSIHPKNGLHLAIKACHLAGVGLRFAGNVADSAYFQDEVLPLLNKKDAYLGHLDHKQLKLEMETARVGLATPQVDEPFGLANIEMLSYGLPLVAFHRGGLSEFLNQENGYLVKSFTVEEMALGISKVKNLCKVRIQQKTIRKWNLDSMVEKYERIYRFLKALHDKDQKEKAYWHLYSSSKQRTMG
jgi:glycosyltransferase involved in cell wall biosynthesis